MKIRPISLRDANRFVLQYHRHHKPVQGSKFAISLIDLGGNLIGVAICGRPVSRHLDNGFTLEVTRLCVKEGHPNACSKLYGACGRIAKQMGFDKIQTYILDKESGCSLFASGWRREQDRAGGRRWNSSGKQIRSDSIINLFGSEKKYPNEMKSRWSRQLN